MCHQLYQSSIDENTRADGIEDTVGEECSAALRWISVADTEANGDGEGSRQTVAETEQVWSPAFVLRPWDAGKPGTETEAFECLMEDEYDVECDEVVGDGKGKADEDRVEDDAKLEDEDGSHLSSVRLRDDTALLPVMGQSTIVCVFAGVTKMVFSTNVVMAVPIGAVRIFLSAF